MKKINIFDDEEFNNFIQETKAVNERAQEKTLIYLLTMSKEELVNEFMEWPFDTLDFLCESALEKEYYEILAAAKVTYEKRKSLLNI